MNKIIITDGGRVAEGFTNEKLDCTVRALALTRRISYKEADAILIKAGRKQCHRFAFYPWMKTQSYAKEVILNKRYTVKNFVESHDEGNYMVWINGHVFAVCGGIALDTFDISQKRYHVKAVMEIEFK